MNGYPEWTPASEKPNQFGWYLVTTDYGGVDVLLYDIIAGKWSRGDADQSVLAWMPIPPAYEPPRFGWHNAKDELPTKEGNYLVQLYLPWAKEPMCDVRAFFKSGEWNVSNKDVRVLYWSHIEPTP